MKKPRHSRGFAQPASTSKVGPGATDSTRGSVAPNLYRGRASARSTHAHPNGHS
jgi:hypothetical protein